ncbi:YfhO family protein [Butyrivibrio sp. MB2005]|uniref:YfhO family protein n=1 Tax=Butyrivibrio sp. MB2005 TaxID=1280678 RepID=UPI000422D726|nr:YfhO family protein [Butyrivibrio sp. MB2005]
MEYYRTRPTHIRIIQIMVLSFVMYMVAALPFFITRGMPFFYYGDYNVQQIPFYMQAHRAIRNGELFLNWNVDLGTTMMTSFSFYLLGSPFFWLTIPFPESAIPYMMPFLMALKYAICAGTAYFYIRKHVIRDESAMIGALLYAFSGFNACNIVFNHFTDVVAFFPLFLYTFDELMEIDHHQDHWFYIPAGKKLVAFSLMTLLMAVINYYFFFGQVVFLLIYFVVRFVPGNRPKQIFRMFLRALFGGVLGCLIGGFYLLQAFYGITGNDRLSELMIGYDAVAYPSMKMLWDIVKSMVMIPDIIGKGTVFYTGEVRVASLAAYLPVFGIAGVVAYFISHKFKKDEYKRLLLVCLIFSFIPILNASFSMFNATYYFRWFYMPILFMAMVTAKMIERGRSIHLKKGVLITNFVYIVILLISIFPSYDKNGDIVFNKLIENTKIYEKQVVGTAVMMVLLVITVFAFPKCLRKIGKKTLKKPIMRLNVLFVLTVFGSVLTLFLMLKAGSDLITDYGKEQWEIQMLKTSPKLEGDEFYRIETDDTATNYEFVWGKSSLHSFISTIPGETFDFLGKTGGINRSVETKIPAEKVGLRAILSQKYYLENSIINKDGIFNNGDGIEEFINVDSRNGIDIYYNENYIPMGIAYDYYIAESDYEEMLNDGIRDKVLSAGVIVSDDDADQLEGELEELPEAYYQAEIPIEFFNMNCEEKRETACVSFKPDTHGFSATTANLDKTKLIFFSVPNMDNFTMTVDGVEAEIINADYGMMAVKVSAGVHEIRADYTPKGYGQGIILTIIGIAVLSAYLVFVRFYKQR